MPERAWGTVLAGGLSHALRERTPRPFMELFLQGLGQLGIFLRRYSYMKNHPLLSKTGTSY